jgi:pimeloyl-ACP methyl ester carboxylesterase
MIACRSETGIQPQIIETRLGPVECARTGDGPAVLLLHGAMGGWDQGLILGQAAVGAGYEFIAVSRPGFLGTPLRLGVAPAQQADLCGALLDSLAIRRAAVIAVSGGGQCALQFALRHSEICAALVMISACSAPIPGNVPLRFRLMMLAASIPAVAAKMSRKAAENPEAMAARSIPDAEMLARTLGDAEVGPLFRANQAMAMSRFPERVPGTRNDIAQARAPFAYPVEQIRSPTLIVHGTEDQAAPYAHAEALAARVPGSELLTIPGGPHVSLFTHRGLIRERVTRLLEAHLREEVS